LTEDAMNTRFSNLRRLTAFAVALGTLVGARAQAAALPAVSLLPPRGESLIGPARVAVDSESRLYVSDPQTGQVVVLDAFGRESFVKSGLGQPLGVAVDHQGRIYVGEAQTGAVGVYDAQWTLLHQLGQGTNEFQLPGHIAVVTSNAVTTVYVSDGLAHQVKAYRDGALVGRFGSFGLGPNQFNFPAGIGVGAEGNLYVVDQNNDRVQVLDPNGNFLRWFNLQSSPQAFSNSGRPQGITGDAAGRLYVADAFHGRVAVFDLAGAFLGHIGGYGAGAGQFRLPGGIVLDPAHRLWVANTGNARVEGFGLDCFVQPAISPAAQLVAVGATVTLSATAGCADGVIFQWLKNGSPLADGGVVSGATNATLTLTGVSTNDAGDYAVTITGPVESVTSPAAALRVTAPPVVVSSPVSRTVAQGATVSLSIGASGDSLAYRWFFNGIEMPVANADTLVLTNVSLLMAGRYWAVVTNVAGAATSAQATLSVMILPGIVVAPTNQTVAERGAAFFTVLASGSAPLAYQWYRDASPLLNQTNAALTLSNVNPLASGSYSARVANAAGSTNSPAAVLTVIPDVTPPVALVAAGGAAASRTILVSFSEAVNPASAGQAARYQLSGPGNLTVVSAVVTNSSRVLLTLSANRNPAGDYALQIRDVTDTAYSANVLSPNPSTLPVQVADAIGTVAWWPLDEASGLLARDAGGSFDGVLENATWVTGRSGSAVNFNGSNGDVQFPALNLNTNTVTITAWLRRSGTQPNTAGIVFTRAGNSIAGLNFGTANELRYHWNDVAATYNFNSGLVPPDNAWAFVALVVEPARAVLYLNTGSGLRSATNTTTHAIEEFNGSGYFGWDPNSATRRFKGALDEVRICNRALTAAEIQALYTATALPPVGVITTPASGSVVNGPVVNLAATVTANGNVINKVEFYSGATLIGVDRTPPYTCTWTNPVAGDCSVRARTSFSPANYTVDSASVSFTLVIPIRATIQMVGGELTLAWSGGNPPYLVQMTTNLANPVWLSVGAATNATSVIVVPDQRAGFYRVLGQ
jgi:sugar lactone lactonase YvrE